MRLTYPTFQAIVVALVTAFVGTTGATAQTQCTFTTECFEIENCTDTSFSLSFVTSSCPRAADPRTIRAQTDFGDLSGREISNTCGGAAPIHSDGEFVLTGDGATYLLSISEAQARLTTHIEGPIAVSYLGACEVVK